MAATTASVPETEPGIETQAPEFLRKINEDYKSKVAHVFVVHGNIYDFCDNTGNRHGIYRTMAVQFDSFIKQDLMPKAGEDKGTRGLQEKDVYEATKGTQKIMAHYTLSQGLEFAHPKSREAWLEFMNAFYQTEISGWRDDWQTPTSLESLLFVLNKWFHASKEVVKQNRVARATNSSVRKELMFTIAFQDCDALFPAGDIATLQGDRAAIVNLRNWARDEQIGDRNRIILLTRHLSDVHESLRGGTVGNSTHSVPKPNLEDREQWLRNFDASMRRRTQKKAWVIGVHPVTQVNLMGQELDDTDENQAKRFSFHDFAVQAAGMSRRQMEDVIMKSWLSNSPVDWAMVRERKQRALEDEYQGIVDFFEPEYGFELIGGHDHLKSYFQRKIILPLRTGDRRLCTRGVLLTGPPGTGKTVISKALAREAKMNFMIGHIDKLFGGLVGETERKTHKFFEAVDSASPVIVFLDELDSVLSSGRSSNADSGVSARVFNMMMTWLSDESRAGRVVVIAATNRPDLLDSALIRSGRFDAKLPALPPQKGDAKGRALIVSALTHKLKAPFSDELKATLKSSTKGIGVLLNDKERVWTGAEMEVVMKEALDNAYFAGRKKSDGKTDLHVTVPDWEKAYGDIIPNTEEVERMTLLSLLYVDHLGYCPAEWRDTAADKKELKSRLKALGWDEDDD